MNHRMIIKKWPGGIYGFSDDVGIPRRRVYSWTHRNHIPIKHWISVWRAAQTKGLLHVTLELIEAGQ